MNPCGFFESMDELNIIIITMRSNVDADLFFMFSEPQTSADSVKGLGATFSNHVIQDTRETNVNVY